MLEKDHTVGKEGMLHQKLKKKERKKRIDIGAFSPLFCLQGSTRLSSRKGIKRMDFGWRDALCSVAAQATLPLVAF